MSKLSDLSSSAILNKMFENEYKCVSSFNTGIRRLIVVILNLVTFHLKRGMSDSQWYPQHLSLIINLEEISLFFLFKNDLILTVFFSEHKCASQFKRNKMSPKITSIVPLKRLYVECKRYFTRPYNYNIVMPSCLMQHGTLYHLY